MTNSELEQLAVKDHITRAEFNAFINENMIRNNFVPIMEHLQKLTKEFTIDEFCDKTTNETSCVMFSTKTENFSIYGQVGYDQFDENAKEKKLMSYDVWWDDECYSHLYTPIEMMNWLSLLFDRINIPIDVRSRYSYIRNQTELIPFKNDSDE